MYDGIPKISFGALKDELKALIWPNGVPENLVAPIDKYFEDAFMDVQKYVTCLQDWHTDVFPACSTFFKCGLSVFDAPKGAIRRVRTFQGEFCDPVTLIPSTFQEVNCWSRRFLDRVSAPANAGLPALPMGFKYPETTTDSVFGRALTGLWTLDRGRLYVAPWLQSMESVVVEWDGLKTKFSDTDLLPDDQGLKRAIRLYVQKEFARDFERDLVAKKDLVGDWLDARGDLIYVCEQEKHLPPQEFCPAEVASLWLHRLEDENPVTGDVSTVVGLLGEYGSDDAEEAAVATLIKGWAVDGIVTLGGNAFLPTSSDGYDPSVGKYFRSFIFPYVGVQPLGAGESAATVNKFWPALGPVDNTNLAAYEVFFPELPNNERYYDIVIGHCHFFVLNCGRDLADNDTEPTGNTVLGLQAGWLRAQMARSTARWKIVVVNMPPSYFPFLDWNFAAMGANLVISAYHRNYERLSVGGLAYVIDGTGGAPLEASPAPATGSVIQDDTHHGALKLTANCKTLTSEFIAPDGTVVDSVEIT